MSSQSQLDAHRCRSQQLKRSRCSKNSTLTTAARLYKIILSLHLREELFPDNCSTVLRACLLGQTVKAGARCMVNGGGPRRRQAAPWSSSSVDLLRGERGGQRAPWSSSSVVKQLRARSKTRCARMRCSNGLERSQQRRWSTKVVSKRTTSYVDGSREHKVLRGTAVRLRVCVYIFVLLLLWLLLWWFDQLTP